MQGDRPTIDEWESLGKKRMQELTDIQSSDPDDYFSRLQELSWIHVREFFNHDLTDRGGFHLALLEFVSLLQDIVINQRGPGILGYFTELELNFSPRFAASYDPQKRVVRLDLGILLYANELEATYRWLDSVLFRKPVAMSLDAISRLVAPSAVQDELTALFHAGEEGLPVSGKVGLTHHIGLTLLRFVIAHELAHLIDFAESPKLQASWRETVWSDYDDALDYCLSVGWLDQARYTQFRRPSLAEPVASRWANEFVADGLGFYTASKTPPPGGIEPHLAYSLLQTAVEIYFHSLVAAYRGDVGTHSHPPPTLRCYVIRAGQRKLRRVSWADFLAEHWRPGFITAELLTTTLRKIGGKL
jgi:hypothetical protein